jgi:hypothetical protein
MRRETREKPREFDRHVRGFFVGLSGILFLTALACAFLFQKHTKAKAAFAEIASLAKSESSTSAEVVTPHTRTGLIHNGSWDVLSSTKSPLHDQNSNDFSAMETLERTEIVEGSTPSFIPGSTPKSSRLSDRMNPMGHSNCVQTSRRKVSYPDQRAIRQRADAQTKKRLVELWHRSLAKTGTAQN